MSSAAIVWQSEVMGDGRELDKLAGRLVQLCFDVNNGALYSAYLRPLHLPGSVAGGVRSGPCEQLRGTADVEHGPLPLAPIDTVRQLVRMGFDSSLSKTAATSTSGGGVPAAARWAQVG